MNSPFDYVFRKLSAAGFAHFIFVFLLFFINGMTLFEVSEQLGSYWFWGAFYVYGILVSCAIDYLIKIRKHHETWLGTLFFYFGFGFLPFIFMFFPYIAYTILAGLVGAFAAGLFYIGEITVAKRNWSKWVFAIIIPAIMVFIALHDFTKKENWQAHETETSYHATFTYFNGEHRIPIELEKGEVLTFTIDMDSVNGAGYGHHVEDENGHYVGMDTAEDKFNHALNKSSITADRAGVYSIVTRGQQMRGSISVIWSKE